MKKKVRYNFIVLILGCGMFLSNSFIFGQCVARTVIKNCKSNFVEPYRYSGCWMSEFTMSNKAQKIQGHFVALEGLKYQIVFCGSESAENVTINIYDHGNELPFMRKLCITTNGQPGTLWKMEPEKSGDYLIEYLIPPTKDGKPRTGCMMLQFGTIIEKGK
jgi:hypothetical protein